MIRDDNRMIDPKLAKELTYGAYGGGKVLFETIRERLKIEKPSQ